MGKTKRLHIEAQQKQNRTNVFEAGFLSPAAMLSSSCHLTHA